jgi:hypothetical protein
VRVAKLGGISPAGDVKVGLGHMAVTRGVPVVREQLALLETLDLIRPPRCPGTPSTIALTIESITVTDEEKDRRPTPSSFEAYGSLPQEVDRVRPSIRADSGGTQARGGDTGDGVS